MDATINCLKQYQVYFCYLILSILIYLSSLIFYRLTLSPLAKFPGPKTAAITHLYETYFQIIKGGTFTWHIDSLHEEYGPVVRISPREIHIKDPDFYSALYTGPGKHRNKDPWFSFISYPLSLFSTESHELHRPRRRVLAEFFKKNSVYKLEPLIQANLRLLCKHFSAANKSDQILELHAAFYSFTADVLSQYAFGTSEGFHYLKEQEILCTWKLRMTALFNFCRLVRHFPILSYVARAIPSLVLWVAPRYGYVYQMEKDVKYRVQSVRASHSKQKDEEVQSFESANQSLNMAKPIYPTILADPTIPASEKELTRLQDDAIFLLMAGTDAPGQVLAITMFHVLNNSQILEKLRDELFSAIPEPTASPNLSQLENLPYLGAVIREGLRLSSVVTTRLPRSAPDEHLQYQQWHIPAGTLVSMSTYFILRDPNIFPEPSKFIPERWDLCPEGLHKLEKYLLPASKGTLGCLGQNVARAWMYHILGGLLRRFDLVLYDTTERNVEMTRDNFIGQTDEGMNNVRVKVVEEYSY